MRVDWKSFKSFLDNTKLYSLTNYMELNNDFYVWIFYEGQSFEVMLNKSTQDCSDFINNYKPLAVLKNDMTPDGVRFSRTMFVGKQKMMHCLFVIYKTSCLESNDDSGFFSLQLRDEQKNLTTDGSQAIYTELDFCVGPTKEYGLLGGTITTLEDIEEGDYCVNALMAPDIPEIYGGHLYFIRNKILHAPRESCTKNAIGVGEVSAPVPGANVLRLQIKHPKGIQRKIQFEVQYYM